jgi:CheY-like chemotaxis protein
VDDPSQSIHVGSGIGLALIKELVELHRWTVSLHSEVGKGSTFILQIPKGRAHLKDDEIVSDAKQLGKLKVKESIEPKTVEGEFELGIKDEITGKLKGKSKIPSSAANLPTILIVEDSPDVRYYLSTILAGDYNLQEAATGEEGLKKSVIS